MGRSGSGLGLAVVWGTVEDHDGYIDVQSTPGQGSTFILYIPTTTEALGKHNKSIDVSEYSGKGETILIIDDDEDQRRMAAEILSSLNYHAVGVASGEEAIAFVKKNRTDLVVLDMLMDPKMDGLDTYSEIVNLNPGQRAIIISGFAETDRVAKTQALGAGTYIRKPYKTEQLAMAVRKELDR